MKTTKVVLANPPVVYSKTGTLENNFKCREFVIPSNLWRISFFRNILNFCYRHWGLGKGVRYGVRAGSRWPWTAERPLYKLAPYPFLMGYAAALLRHNGHAVEMMDAVICGENSYDRFLNRIRHSNPDIVLMECSASTLDIDLWFAKKVSEFAEVAMAGSHVVQNAEKLMEKYPYVRYWLKGEYILSSARMAAERKPGIYASEILKDLDSVPFPFRDYPESTFYFEHTMPTPQPQLQIYASKGCPFKCSYCLWPQTMYKGQVSLRRPEKVAEEIRQCVARYGYKSVLFDDDTFNIGNERISWLCDHLKEIGLPWTMMGRLDTSPLWLFDKMVNCGCVGMRFGVETFDPGVSKNIKKGLEVDNVHETLKYLSSTYPKLRLDVMMMKNLPGQTKEIVQHDMEILEDLGFVEKRGVDILRSYRVASCVPFPGTSLYEDFVKKYGLDTLQGMEMYDGNQEKFRGLLEKLYD